MPQAPLPAPAARISPPIFQPLNPGTYMSREPMNVLPYVTHPSMFEAAQRGIQTAQALAKLPAEAQHSIAQMNLAKIAQANSKATLDRIKAIQKSGMSDAEKTYWIHREALNLGAVEGTGGGAIQPSLPVESFGAGNWRMGYGGGWPGPTPPTAGPAANAAAAAYDPDPDAPYLRYYYQLHPSARPVNPPGTNPPATSTPSTGGGYQGFENPYFKSGALAPQPGTALAQGTPMPAPVTFSSTAGELYPPFQFPQTPELGPGSLS